MSAEEFTAPKKTLARQLGRRSRSVRRQRQDSVALSSVPPLRNDPNIVLDIRPLAIASLRAPRREIRKIDPAHVAEVATSIRTFGLVRPPLVANGEIVDGVVVVEACKSLGMDVVNCAILTQHSPTYLRAVRVALNRLQEKGNWQLEELQIELRELLELDMPPEVLGFTTQEVDQILEYDAPTTDKKANRTPLLDGKAVTSRLGDVWLLGRHRVMCGSATDPRAYARLFSEMELAKCLFTDPPYNIPIAGFAVAAGSHREFVEGSGEKTDEGYETFLREFFVESSVHLRDGSAVFVCIDWRHIEHMQRAARAAGLHHVNTIVWAKGQGGLGGIYRSAHEMIPLFQKGQGMLLNNVELGKHGRDRNNVWHYPGANQPGSSAHAQLGNHPTPKPVELIADALMDVTARGDSVLDPFAGSGTTIIAAEMKRRTALAIELDPKYVDLIVRRYQEFTGHEALLQDSGETFNSVIRARADQNNGMDFDEADEVKGGKNV